MNLLEYQAKDLFREMGIPVLPSQRIEQLADLKNLQIPYPVVLKSQVYAGGRGKAGGIKFAENTIDAIAVAQSILHLPIMGQYPQLLLAESKYESEREFYLAITLDRSARRPLLLGSQEGGIGVESALDQMQYVIVDQEFSPFYARRLAIKMGLQGNLIQSVSAIVEKMYALFVQQDLDLVEINPLGVNHRGELMALDGKVVVNDDALFRHPDLMELADIRPSALPHTSHIPLTSSLGMVEMNGKQGNIGVLCSGAGLTMATLDLLDLAGGTPGMFLNLGGECRYECPPQPLAGRILNGLELITQNSAVTVILVNILSNALSASELLETLLQSQKQTQRCTGSLPSLVVRWAGRSLDWAASLPPESPVTVVESLDEAIAKTVELAAA